MTGTIKTKTDKGFGFIAVEGQEKDIFFHSSDLNGVSYEQLQEGDTVNLDLTQSEKGPRAVNVTPA